MSKINKSKKFYPHIYDPIIEAISHNVPYKLACHNGGVGYSTFDNWIRRGRIAAEEGVESEYVDFYWKLKKVEVEKVMTHLDMIEKGERGWQARAWILTRRHADLFGEHAFQLQEALDRIKQLEDRIEKGRKSVDQANK